MATNAPRFRLLGSLLLALISAVSVFAPVVSADEPTYLIDAWIKRSGGPAYGKHIYNLSGVDQSIYLRLQPNVLRRAYVTVQNQGDVATAFTMTMLCCGSSADTVRVFRGRGPVEITADAEAGTFVTPVLAPGATYTVRVTVRTDGDAVPGSYYARKFIFSAEGGGVPDAVRMWVIRP